MKSNEERIEELEQKEKQREEDSRFLLKCFLFGFVFLILIISMVCSVEALKDTKEILEVLRSSGGAS